MTQRVQLHLNNSDQDETSKLISTESNWGDINKHFEIPQVLAQSDSLITLSNFSLTQEKVMQCEEQERRPIYKISTSKLGDIFITKGVKAARLDESSNQHIGSNKSLVDVQQSYKFGIKQLDLTAILPHLKNEHGFPQKYKKIVSKHGAPNQITVNKLPFIIPRERKCYPLHSLRLPLIDQVQSATELLGCNSEQEKREQLNQAVESRISNAKVLESLQQLKKIQRSKLLQSRNQHHSMDFKNLDFQSQIRRSKISANPLSRVQLQDNQQQTTSNYYSTNQTPMEEFDKMRPRLLNNLTSLEKQLQKASAQYLPNKKYVRIDLQEHHQLVPLSTKRTQPLFEKINLNSHQKPSFKSNDEWPQRFNEIKIIRKPRQRSELEKDTVLQQIKELKIQRLR